MPQARLETQGETNLVSSTLIGATLSCVDCSVSILCCLVPLQVLDQQAQWEEGPILLREVDVDTWHCDSILGQDFHELTTLKRFLAGFLEGVGNTQPLRGPYHPSNFCT